MKKIIRRLLHKFDYEIIKQKYLGDKYPDMSSDKEFYYSHTPIGKYFLPKNVEADAVTNTMARGKLFEPEIIEIAKRYIKPGTVVIDVGANFGQMSIEFSKLADGVYAIEAQPFVCFFLYKNVIMNAKNPVVIIEKAAYYNTGETLYFPLPEQSLYKGSPYSGLALLPDAKKGTPVKTIEIDDIFIHQPISFIKIDVQGSDLFAMRGAIKTIEKHKPAIIFEYEEPLQKQFGTCFNDYVEFVRSINYKFVEISSQINYLIVPK